MTTTRTSAEEAVDGLVETATWYRLHDGDRVSDILERPSGRALREARQTVLARMGNDKPPKTEEVWFGALKPGEKFLNRPSGWTYFVIGEEGIPIKDAVALDGPNPGLPVRFHEKAPVDKIIK